MFVLFNVQVVWKGKSVEVLAAEDEVVAEVFVADSGVLGELFAGALEQDFALK